MTRRPLLCTIPLLAAVALVAVGCGSSTDSSSDTVASQATVAAPPTAPPSTSNSVGTGSQASVTTVRVAQSSLGPIVVDGAGLTLYIFTPDTGSTSTCTGGCATAWPPLAGPATAGDGVTGEVAVSTRPDGSQQVTLAGHPLYRYATDSAEGDVNGQGVGGKWYVVNGSGTAVTSTAATPSTGY